ncbi:lipase family alpha/beta hydrolase [Acinetobacter gerneri]|jgi:hypothetical protein|uniref:lipase family alpha/beta hydrolase n=1 Tax=Acinetobacter gerneri TaxID=202952 RepID=UPI0023F54878|nr:hypothetical protein [Acinetobacter gerneri]MCH4245202.1 hypothetical protein [Acinetobacter gerneri]
MNNDTEATYVHDAYETQTIDGEVQYTSQTTPKSSDTTCQVVLHPYVVPIIFIPGIMGSNLVNGEKRVWFPPNFKWGETAHILGTLLFSGVFLGAARRQKQLNPEQTEVSPDGNIYIKKGDIKLSEKEARARGWGTVWWQGYGKILVYLEKYLNDNLINPESADEFKGTEEWKRIVDIDPESTLAKIKELALKWIVEGQQKENNNSNLKCLSQDQFKKMARVSFPVYACGYNWLQSNGTSAQKVIEIMQKIKQQYAKSNYPKFLKFIIVSHSMGGLVTRSIIQQGTLETDIGGVVHGVMPSSGAPTVYQRMVNGWEGGMASVIFGSSSKRLTPVLANAPGALQLLPFGNFRNKGKTEWLNIQTKSHSIAIPAAGQDVYEELYKKQGIWWEMINPNFVDPAGILKKKLNNEYKEEIDFYHKNIDIVKDFHITISDIFHENTYAHYASDENHMAFGEVTWIADESKEQVMIVSPEELLTLGSTANNAEIANDPFEYSNEETTQSNIEGIQPETEYNASENPYKDNGVRMAQYGNNQTVTFKIVEDPQSPGDGTVCYQSGEDVRAEGRALKQTFLINGYDHSENYNHPDVQLNTIYCIAKIIDDFIENC